MLEGKEKSDRKNVSVQSCLLKIHSMSIYKNLSLPINGGSDCKHYNNGLLSGLLEPHMLI